MNDLTELWAKDTGETLLTHSLLTAKLAGKICSQLPCDAALRSELARSVALIGALHDVGKAATGFQDALRRKGRWGRRHEILSAAIAGHVSPNISQAELLAIITHHRVILHREAKRCLPQDELPYDAISSWNEMADELLQNLPALEIFLKELGKRANLELTLDGLKSCVEADKFRLKEAWITDDYQKRQAPPGERRQAALLRGLLMTSDHLASAHKFNLPSVPVLADYHSIVLRHEFGGYEPRPFQARCGETIGDAILKAPTGSGKTGAILLWTAHNQSENGRLFYTLPHTASINAMHGRLSRIYGEDSVGVLHHKNAAYLYRLFEKEGCSYVAQKKASDVASLARELYHPIRVTTPHQILRVALRGKGWEMGLAEFENACFVFDEVHAFEPLLVGLTIATAKWLKSLGAKLLFASATIPQFLEAILQSQLQIPPENIIAPNPNLSQDNAVLDRKRHRISVREGSLVENLDSVIREIKTSAQTTLIVCNHVATSQAVWRSLNENYSIKAMLLHSRFNSRDRAQIEAAITGGEPPHILVATQAVEVSLNLDYERGYSEPAPADALGQRFGRINRQGARPPTEVVVFAEPSQGHLYDEDTTNRTVDLLRGVDELTETQLTDIVNEVYGAGYSDEAKKEYERGLNNEGIRDFEKELIAGLHRPWVEEIISGTDGQIEVLPSSLIEEFTELKREKSYILARQLLVPIRIGQYFKAITGGGICRDEKLRELVTTLQYDSDFGLNLSQQTDNIF
jgi:CRISPR-associated endonuclease/helicase Cas3